MVKESGVRGEDIERFGVDCLFIMSWESWKVGCVSLAWEDCDDGGTDWKELSEVSWVGLRVKLVVEVVRKGSLLG